MFKILLVDDDDSFRTMLRKTLIKFGYEVTEAANGREADKLLSTDRFDLMLTDLIMPEREGLETIEDLRRADSAIKIVAMSGGGRINAGDFLRIARFLGANRTLAKPFSNDELLATLTALLPGATIVPAGATPTPQ